MANEPRVPEVRDDDPEEVADKLSIAAAMWGRGDRADALSWLRRAAESASDADQDVRALELAKAASELASLGDGAAGAAAPAPEPVPASAPQSTKQPSAAPPPRPKTAPPAKPSIAPAGAAAPGRAPAAAASTLPKKPALPSARPPGSKLPPLPPMRPLGTPAAAPAKPARLPSMITSAAGMTTASGTVHRDDTPAPPEPGKPMPWDDQPEVDDEPTKQIALTEDVGEIQDFDETATREIPAVAMQPAREEPRERAPASAPVARELPLAVGVRVRVLVASDGVHVVPEGDSTEGVAAVIVPLDPKDDLRPLFQRRA